MCFNVIEVEIIEINHEFLQNGVSFRHWREISFVRRLNMWRHGGTFSQSNVTFAAIISLDFVQPQRPRVI